jgi:hypothetical protein
MIGLRSQWRTLCLGRSGCHVGEGGSIGGARQWLPTATCLQESVLFLVRSSQANLGLRASYRHGGRDPLPTDVVVTPLILTLREGCRGLGLKPTLGIEINSRIESWWANDALARKPSF